MNKQIEALYQRYGRNLVGEPGELPSITEYRQGHLWEAQSASSDDVLVAINGELFFVGNPDELVELAQRANVDPAKIDMSHLNLNPSGGGEIQS